MEYPFRTTKPIYPGHNHQSWPFVPLNRFERNQTSTTTGNINKYNKPQPDSSDWGLYLIRQKLFLSALVSLVELIDTTCSIHELNLTGVEWM